MRTARQTSMPRTGKAMLWEPAPLCTFTAAYIQRHPEYVDLVDTSLRDRFVPST
jgi:hypothetical protein